MIGVGTAKSRIKLRKHLVLIRSQHLYSEDPGEDSGSAKNGNDKEWFWYLFPESWNRKIICQTCGESKPHAYRGQAKPHVYMVKLSHMYTMVKLSYVHTMTS